MTLALEGHSSSKMWALVDVHMGFQQVCKTQRLCWLSVCGIFVEMLKGTCSPSSILMLKCCCLCHETDVRVARLLTDLHCVFQHKHVVYHVVSTLLGGVNEYDWHLGHLQKQYVLSDRHKPHAF